jgi:hypothetical protein
MLRQIPEKLLISVFNFFEHADLYLKFIDGIEIFFNIGHPILIVVDLVHHFIVFHVVFLNSNTWYFYFNFVLGIVFSELVF